MGKFEVNPVIVAESDTDSDSSTDYSEESSDDEICGDAERGAPQGRGRQRHRGPMTAPWAPLPYLRRAWTPESNKQSSSQSQRSQSMPESSSIPADSKNFDKKETKAEKKIPVDREALQQWKKWQFFMKCLEDEMFIDANVGCEMCDAMVGCKERKVQFAEAEPPSAHNLAWDDNPQCTMLPDGASEDLGQACAMAATTSFTGSKVEEEFQQPDGAKAKEQQRKEGKKEAVLEKRPDQDRVRFRQLVRKNGPSRWMLDVLTESGVPAADKADRQVFQNRGNEMTERKRQELKEAIASIGPKPWMVDVVINQAKAVATEFNKSDASEKGNKTPNEDRMKFRQLVRKLGPAQWMMRVLANNGVEEAAEMDITTIGPETNDKMTEVKRLALRQAIKGIGPKPWMADVVKNQAKAVADRRGKPEKTEKKYTIEITKPTGERMMFRQVVRKLGPGPWMLRVLGNNGVPEAKDEKVAALINAKPGNEVTDEKRKTMRGIVKTIGPKSWMVDVVINQAKISSETVTEPSIVVTDEKKLFRRTVISMGPRPWMFQVLGNNGVPEAKAVKAAEFQFPPQEDDVNQKQQKRRTFRRIVNILGPKQWMLQSLVNQCKPKDEKKDEIKKETTVEKRREFRQMVKKMKPGSWMIEVLSNNGVQQMVRYPTCVPNDNTNVQEKRVEFRHAMQRMGPKPWMTKVVINQANVFAKVETRQFPPTGNTDTEMSDPDVKEECEKMKKNRKAYAEMVRQMRPRQWMLRVLFNQGLKEAQEIDISKEIGKTTDDETQTKQKRQEFVQLVKKIGPKPWMIKMVVNQARRVADKDKLEETTDDEKAAEKVKDEIHNKRREFVFALNQMKLRPWMLKVLANHGVADAETVDVSIFEDTSPFNASEEQQDRMEFRQMIKRIGPRLWMVRVIRNQAIIHKAKKADVLPGPNPEDLMTQVEKRNKFRKMIKEMGAEPWMFQVLANQMTKALEKQKVFQPSRTEGKGIFPPDGDVGTNKPDDVKKQKDTHKMMRQMQRKNLLGPPAASDQRKQTRGTVITAPAAGTADDSRESEDDPDAEQMSHVY